MTENRKKEPPLPKKGLDGFQMEELICLSCDRPEGLCVCKNPSALALEKIAEDVATFDGVMSVRVYGKVLAALRLVEREAAASLGKLGGASKSEAKQRARRRG